MTEQLHLTFELQDWFALLTHYLTLSLLSVSGAMAAAPDMHRFLVDQHHWLTDAQFNASIAIAQAAPGPNVLFVALLGWNVGMNAGSMGAASLGLVTTMAGILTPSTILTCTASDWLHKNRHLLKVRAFKQGMAPIGVAMLIATGWILATANPHGDGSLLRNWPAWLLTALTTLIVWRTRIHLLWLLGAGALLGGLGII